jgi:rhodanese-related sulfurtransferase
MGLLEISSRTTDEPAPVAAGEEIRVPEVTAGELLLEQCDSCAPVLLDCREDYEWQQLRIPGSLHIPMRQIPRRLSEIDKHGDIVVVCAHGERSYRMASYLIDHGFCARSLRGGLAEWRARGGKVENGHHQ